MKSEMVLKYINFISHVTMALLIANDSITAKMLVRQQQIKSYLDA